jgi:hypothetical protein
MGIACIYLNHKETEVQTPTKLLAGLWRQLVLGRDIDILAKNLYQQHFEKGTAPLLEDVADVLRSTLAQFSTVHIVVDAIDEYPEAKRWILLQHLVALEPKVNLMITSRPNIIPEASLPNLNALEIRADDNDVRRYVDAQIRMSPRLSKHVQSRPGLREEIHSKITDNVDGM